MKVIELGKILAEVFPNLSRVQKRINGERTWVYKLSKINTHDQPTDDSIHWENLPDLTAEFGWLLTNRADDHFEWVKMKSQDLCDGQRIIYELTIYKDWTYTVKVNHREIAKETLGILALSSSKRIVRSLFHVISASRECKGFPVPTNKVAKDIKGNTIGKTEEWRNQSDCSVVLNLRSITCRVLIQNNYSRGSSQICDECSRIKRNCTISCHENAKSALQTRESYMSKEELQQKLQEEKVRRVNAERRVKYWRSKIENEMKTFVEEDHNEFVHMFQSVKKDSLDDDMKIFWEAQEKALQLNNSKGYRWHPK